MKFPIMTKHCSLVYFGVFCVLATTTLAQVKFSGPCPTNVNVVPNFNVQKYLGTWYENRKYPALFQGNGKCVTAKYTAQADGNVGVLNSQIDPR